MKLMRVRRKSKSMMLFLPDSARERLLLEELANAPTFSLTVEPARVANGDALGDPGPSVVVEYFEAAAPAATPDQTEPAAESRGKK